VRRSTAYGKRGPTPSSSSIGGDRRVFEIVSTKVDLRPGGVFHYHLRSPDGQDMWGKFIYREIVPQKRLVFVVSFSDEAGGVTRHLLHEKWPLTILSTVTS
jgi:uncharacterized protein YndB with AHSA1/START domain